MKDKGTIIADMCYEYFDEAGRKKHRKIGSLLYYRSHVGDEPTAQFRWDLLPSTAWAKNPDTYFIGNFMPSEKVPEPPYVCGMVYVPSDVRGERVQVGHIGSRQRADGDETQYYMQLFGVPLRELSKAVTKGYRARILEVFDGVSESICDAKQLNEILTEAESVEKKHSLYCGIELE